MRRCGEKRTFCVMTWVTEEAKSEILLILQTIRIFKSTSVHLSLRPPSTGQFTYSERWRSKEHPTQQSRCSLKQDHRNLCCHLSTPSPRGLYIRESDSPRLRQRILKADQLYNLCTNHLPSYVPRQLREVLVQSSSRRKTHPTSTP